MKPITYSMQFRGSVGETAPGHLEGVLTAPSSNQVTTIGRDGVEGRFLPASGGDARCVFLLSLAADGSFDRSGRISFGRGNAIWFRTIGRGSVAPSADPHLSHGTAMCEIERGEGRFEGASGRITSNFFLSDSGEVTDNHFGVVFLDGRNDEREERDVD
ncbi:MAG: hypothetical protein H0U03_08545 [Actinobacteria bacterium]|nr:hypothetical protein [Actinomycetota bacterium]